MKRTTVTILATTLFVSFSGISALAHSPFKKPFEEKYVTPSDDADYKLASRKASCNICHVKGKAKDWLNGYGLELAKHIPGNVKERLAAAKLESRDAYKAENEKLLEELKEALKKADKAKMKSEQTYGDFFKELKLPTEEGARSLYDEPEDDDKDDKDDKSTDTTDKN